MAKSCCDKKSDELFQLAKKQSGILKFALVINLGMFLVESYYGFVANSVSLLADSLDMLGDAMVYGFSLYVLRKDIKWNIAASILKGLAMFIFGTGVLVNACIRFFSHATPSFETMGAVGIAALVANILCAFLLLRHKSDDLNMRSAWLCSRNDVIANIGVLIAAWAVMTFSSKFPDLFVGIIISFIVIKSSVGILRDSVQEYRNVSA